MMKRFSERFKQKLGVGNSDRDWTPTSAGRIHTMQREIKAFAQQVKATKKQVKELSHSVEGGLSTFKSVLLAPLPGAHEETAEGIVRVDPEVRPIGLNVNAEFLTTANTEVQQRLQQEVMAPLEQWMVEYRKAKESMKKFDQMRLDLDNKRRVTLKLQDKYRNKKNKKKDTEKTLHKVQGEEDKLKRLAEYYTEKEAEMFNTWVRLIRDSAVTRDFIAAALAILQRGFTTAYTAFAMAPVTAAPMLPSPAQVPLQYYTPADINVADNMRVNASELVGGANGPMPLHSHITGTPPTTPPGANGAAGPGLPGQPPVGPAGVPHAHHATTPYPQHPPSPDGVARMQVAGTTNAPNKAGGYQAGPTGFSNPTTGGYQAGPMGGPGYATPPTPAGPPPPQPLMGV